MELEYLIIMILRFTKFQTYVCRLAEKSVAEEKENDKRERERKRKKNRYGITCALKRRSYLRRVRIIDARFTGDFIRSTIFGDNDRRGRSSAMSTAVSIENRCVLYSTYEAERRRRASSARLSSAWHVT